MNHTYWETIPPRYLAFCNEHPDLSFLCRDLPAKLALVEGVAAGVDIITASALESGGCQSVAPYLIEGCTLAFVGSSGVGKSTLINALLGEDRLRIGEFQSCPGSASGCSATMMRSGF